MCPLGDYDWAMFPPPQVYETHKYSDTSKLGG